MARARIMRIACAALLLGGSPLARGASAQAEDLQALRTANAWLRVRAELAEVDGFYLVLVARDRVLRLMHGGALVHETPLVDIEIGVPRVLFFPGETPRLEPRIWTAPALSPPANWQRTVITPPPPDAPAETEVAIPPTPEEAFPAPSRYRIHYAEGLELEIVSPGSDPDLGSRLADAFAAAGFGDRDGPRLRLVMVPAPAGAFYRSLPGDTRLLVVPSL
jgi:hypothetical protein